MTVLGRLFLGNLFGYILDWDWQNIIFQRDDLKGHFDMVHLQLDVVKVFQPGVKVSFFFGATWTPPPKTRKRLYSFRGNTILALSLSYLDNRMDMSFPSSDHSSVGSSCTRLGRENKLMFRSQFFSSHDFFPMISEQESDELLCLVANFVGFISGPSSKGPAQ